MAFFSRSQCLHYVRQIFRYANRLRRRSVQMDKATPTEGVLLQTGLRHTIEPGDQAVQPNGIRQPLGRIAPDYEIGELCFAWHYKIPSEPCRGLDMYWCRIKSFGPCYVTGELYFGENEPGRLKGVFNDICPGDLVKLDK